MYVETGILIVGTICDVMLYKTQYLCNSEFTS